MRASVKLIVFLLIPYFLCCQRKSISNSEPSGPVYTYHSLIEIYDDKYTGYNRGLMFLSYNLSKNDYALVSSPNKSKNKYDVLNKYVPDTLNFLIDSNNEMHNPYDLFEIQIEDLKYDFVFKGSSYLIRKEIIKSHDIHILEKVENADKIFYGSTIEVEYLDNNSVIGREKVSGYLIPAELTQKMVELGANTIKILVFNKYKDQLKMSFKIR